MFGKIMTALLAASSLVACSDHASQEREDGTFGGQEQEIRIPEHLKELRRLNSRYHSLDAAAADGFAFGINGLLQVCVAHPTLGAMGYHYGNQERFEDVTIDELAPEVLVYQTADDGSLKLGAVEWVVPKVAWDAVHGVDAPPPMVHGHELMVLNTALNWYVGHAWLWEPNPSGILADWNPLVTCP